MAKSLRNKLANMALCCTVVTGTVGQVAPVFAQGDFEIQNEVTVENEEAADGEEVSDEEAVEAEEVQEEENTEAVEDQKEVEAEEVIDQEESAAEEEVIDQEESAAEEEVIDQEESAAEEEVIDQEESAAEEEVTDQEESTAEEEVTDQEESAAGEEVTNQEESVIEEIENQETDEAANKEQVIVDTVIPEINDIVVSENQNIAETVDTQDLWEDEKADAQHFGSIKVLKADSEAESMAAQFFTQTELPIEIVDGKVYLKLQVAKDGLGFKNVITALEKKTEGGNYENLTLKYADQDDVRYITAEIDFDNIEEPVTLRCSLNIGMTMKQELRIFLTEGTISYLKSQGIGAPKTAVTMNVTHTDETAYEAADGSITITAEGGSGTYEYTVDGGQSWHAENVFENLAANTYSVAVRDAANPEDVTAFETVEVIAKEKPVLGDEMVEGAYQVDIEVLHETKDEASKLASYVTQENVSLNIEDGKAYLTFKIARDDMKFGDNGIDMIGSLGLKVGESYEALDLSYVEDEAGTRYIVTEIALDSLNAEAYIQCQMVRPFAHTAVVRVRLTSQSLNKILAETQQVEILNVEKTDAAAAAADGSIKITAAGGSGNYEYTIDGGQSWSASNVFTGLGAGTYSVAVRAQEYTENVTAFQDVVIDLKSEMPEGTYEVDIEVLHETQDQPSHAAGYFAKENVALNIKEGKAYLTLKVARDAGSFLDMMKGLDVLVGDTYEPLELSYIEDETGRYIVSEIALESLYETAYVKCHVVLPIMPPKEYPVRIKLTADSISKILGEQVPEVTPVEIAVQKLEETNTITVTATGGSGEYEYTIDGGSTWVSHNKFENLAAGIYKVGARDLQDAANSSVFQEVEMVQKTEADKEELQDGYYSVDISVLHETQDTASMASNFFNKEGLPLRIQNGEAYLTVQILKDGMGMKDVITSLEQRVDGEYSSLYLNYLTDSSKRYVTAEVKLSSISDTAYLRCGISAMGGMKPVLRIKLDQSSIQEGAGSINTEFKSDEAMTINKVEAENGKVTVYLNGTDAELTANDFTGKVYLNGATTGDSLTLKDFKMENDVVTFTYDAIEASEKNQTVIIGITLNEVETKSVAFTVKGLTSTNEAGVLRLKENAQEVKYIKGYEDGTFKPNGKVTKAEALSMLSLLVESVKNNYYSANISILQAAKDETSMAGQFFKNEGITIKKQGENYIIELEIANEGLGFTDIITGVEQKVNGQYETVEVRKSADMKKAYVTLEVKSLDEAITLKTGIAPMGSVAPELRIVVDTKSLKETGFVSEFTDIDMWAKEAISVFEEAGVIGNDGSQTFSPDAYMTRAEFVKIIAQVAGLEASADYVHGFKDLTGHAYESYIAAATEAGYINGYGNSTFKPEGTLTRAEAVKIINKLVGHTEDTNVDTENPFKDLSANHWAYDEILKVTQF